MEKIEVYSKSKPVASNQPSSFPNNSKPPMVSLKVTTQNNIDDFPYTSPTFKTVISITSQKKQLSFTRDWNNILNSNIEAIIQTPCLSLASENKCKTRKLVVINAYIGELIEGKETVAGKVNPTDYSTRIILQKVMESRSLPPIDVLRLDGGPSK